MGKSLDQARAAARRLSGGRASRAGGRRSLRIALVLATALVMDMAAAGGNFAIRNGTVAGGGGDASAGGIRVIWTIGEAAMGTISAGGFRLTSGFPATIGDSGIQGGPIGGAIFKDGFEGTGGTP